MVAKFWPTGKIWVLNQVTTKEFFFYWEELLWLIIMLIYTMTYCTGILYTHSTLHNGRWPSVDFIILLYVHKNVLQQSLSRSQLFSLLTTIRHYKNIFTMLLSFSYWLHNHSFFVCFVFTCSSDRCDSLGVCLLWWGTGSNTHHWPEMYWKRDLTSGLLPWQLNHLLWSLWRWWHFVSYWWETFLTSW